MLAVSLSKQLLIYLLSVRESQTNILNSTTSPLMTAYTTHELQGDSDATQSVCTYPNSSPHILQSPPFDRVDESHLSHHTNIMTLQSLGHQQNTPTSSNAATISGPISEILSDDNLPPPLGELPAHLAAQCISEREVQDLTFSEIVMVASCPDQIRAQFKRVWGKSGIFRDSFLNRHRTNIEDFVEQLPLAVRLMNIPEYTLCKTRDVIRGLACISENQRTELIEDAMTLLRHYLEDNEALRIRNNRLNQALVNLTNTDSASSMATPGFSVRGLDVDDIFRPNLNA